MGAVLSHASWPAITCVNLFSCSLLTAETDIRVIDGYQAVPTGHGLGVQVDEQAVRRYSADPESLLASDGTEQRPGGYPAARCACTGGRAGS